MHNLFRAVLLFPFLVFWGLCKAIARMLSLLGETALYLWDRTGKQYRGQSPSSGKPLNYRYRGDPGSRLRADRHRCTGCGKQTVLSERLLSFSQPECFECRRRRKSIGGTQRPWSRWN